MKKVVLLLSQICLFVWPAFSQMVESRVYSYDNATEKMAPYGSSRAMFSGVTTDLKVVELVVITLNPGKSYAQLNTTTNENLLIVKDGLLSFKLNEQPHDLTPGSVAMILPGSDVSVTNDDGRDVEFYLMSYVGKSQAPGRTDTLQSFVKIWEEIDFKSHDKGGIRNFYDLPTVMTDYSEMHVTNLNGLIKSHEPHVHRAAEIVLMISGATEMEIGDGMYQGQSGDVYFLGSNVSHAIQNTGEEQCQYFAIQWQ